MKTAKRYSPNTFNAVHASVAFLGFWAMNLIVGIVYLLIGNVAGADVAAGEYILDYYADMCFQLLLMAAGLAALTAIMCLAAKVRPINGGGFLVRKGLGMEVLMAFVLMFGMCALFMPLAESFADNCEYIRYVGLGQSPDLQVDPEASAWALPLLFLLPVLPAIFEELLFRGIILRGFLQFGKVPAVVISALMFAFAHGSYQQFIYQFLAGLVFGFLYVETKNIFVGMSAHFANNFFSSWVLGIAYIFVGTGPNAAIYESVVSVMFYLVGAVCLIAGFLYFGKRTLHMRKSPDRSCGEVTATFVEYDVVSGTFYTEKPWYECGDLLPKGGEARDYLTSSGGRVGVNRKSGFAISSILTGIGIVIGIVFFFLSFFS